MTMRTKVPLAVIALLIIVRLPVGWAGEPNDSTISLEFTVQETTIGPLDASWLRRSAGPGQKAEAFAAQKPAYAVGIPFERPVDYLPRPGSGRMNDFLHYVLGETLGMAGTDAHDELSAAQKEFLWTTRGLLEAERKGGPVPQWYYPEDEPNSYGQVLLYAVTLQDAKAMAEAYAQFAMTRWRREFDNRRERLEAKREEIAAGEKRIAELPGLIESFEKALEALKPKVPYRTEREATEAIAELDRMLNAARVDIAGIQSKIRAIQNHLASRKSPYDDAIKAKLQSMFVEESVALEGAEARRKMATQLRADASNFLDLRETLAHAKKEKEELQGKIIDFLKVRSVEESKVQALMMSRPVIMDRVIPIYPVEWAAESEDGSRMGPASP